jgi:hypothetical protein
MRGGIGSLSGRAGASPWSDLPVSGRTGVPLGTVLPLNRILYIPLVIQGSDTSSRPFTGTGTRHVTSLSPDRDTTHHVTTTCPGTNALSPDIRRQVFTFTDSVRCFYSVDEVFNFFLCDSRGRTGIDEGSLDNRTSLRGS